MTRSNNPRRGGLCALALALAVCAAGDARAAWPTFSDPVRDLRQSLRVLVRDTSPGSLDLAYRRQALQQRAAALRTLHDLREALRAPEWRDEDVDEAVAAIDRAVRADIARRLEQGLCIVLQQGEAASRLAAVSMLADAGAGLDEEGRRGWAPGRLGPALAALIRSGDARFCEPAAIALGRINSEPAVAVPVLTELLRAQSPFQRQAAAAGLAGMVQTAFQTARNPARFGNDMPRTDVVRIGRAVAPAAARGLADPDAEVRRRCADALRVIALTLGELVGDRCLSPEDDRDQAAAYGAEVERERGELEPLVAALQEQTPALSRALADPDAAVRLLAHHALEDLSNAWLKLQRRGACLRAVSAVRPVAAHRDEGSAGQPEAFLPPPTATIPDQLRDALPSLAAGLGDQDVRVRRAAMDALETLGPSAAPAAAAVVGALADRDRFVRWAAARTLGKLAPTATESAVPGLAWLLGDTDIDLRLAAAEALGRYGFGARAAIPELARAVVVGDAEVRVAAICALERVGSGDGPVVPALTAALTDRDARVRLAAAQLLSRLGPAAGPAVNALQVALADGDAGVRSAATEALLEVGRYAVAVQPPTVAPRPATPIVNAPVPPIAPPPATPVANRLRPVPTIPASWQPANAPTAPASWQPRRNWIPSR
jgi:HEAT repeat protein